MGSVVKSNITGFRRMASSPAEHLNGCNRYWVEPKVDEDGKPRDEQWIDEYELDVVKKAKRARVDDMAKPGGFSSKIK